MLLAYLDPGTGSALVGTIIALAGAALFSAKSVFYRLFGKGTAIEEPSTDTLAIFSEGKNYWSTFRPIVDELIRRQINFRYYTFDLHDPALEIDSPYMHSRLYDSHSPAAYHKLAKVEAPVMLSTTPNIGCDGYPVKRPAGVKKLVHVFHAFADVSAYALGSLDHYDAAIMVGPHQEAPIRQVEAARGLAPKELVALGLPYIDDQAAQLEQLAQPSPQEAPVVLVAASWGAKGCLREYGTGFIRQLSEAGFNVIIRPHPQSYMSEAEFMKQCEKETAGMPNVSWDRATVGLESMALSDILISDTSSIRFDYAFLFGKPVITLAIPRERQDEYEGRYMESIWTDEAAGKIGAVVEKNEIDGLAERVQEILAQPSQQSLVSYRDEVIRNFGSSARAIVEYLTS